MSGPRVSTTAISAVLAKLAQGVDPSDADGAAAVAEVVGAGAAAVDALTDIARALASIDEKLGALPLSRA